LVLALPAKDREQLADIVYASLNDAQSEEVTEVWEQEIKQRL